MLSRKWADFATYHPDNAQRIEELLRWMADGTVVPFIGAGMSVDSGYPGWTGFLEKRASELNLSEPVRELIERGDFEHAADCLLQPLGPAPFQMLFRDVFGRDAIIRGAVRLLPDVFQAALVTTNFDRVVERAYALAGRPLAVVSGPEWRANDDPVIHRRPVLLKIHGDAADPERRVLTASEYDRHYAAGATLNRMLHALFTGAHVLFLGASLGTDRTCRILQETVNEGKAREHFALVEIPAGEDALRERNVSLLARGIRPIWYPTGRHDRVEHFLELARRRQRWPRRFLFGAAAMLAGCAIVTQGELQSRYEDPNLGWVMATVEGERANVKVEERHATGEGLPGAMLEQQVTATSTGDSEGNARLRLRRLAPFSSFDLGDYCGGRRCPGLEGAPDFTLWISAPALEQRSVQIQVTDGNGKQATYVCKLPAEGQGDPHPYMLFNADPLNRSELDLYNVREISISFIVPAGKRQFVVLNGIVKGSNRQASTCERSR
jgi:hypothetical protein